MTKLTSLSFLNCKITDAGVEAMLKNFPHLRQLAILGNLTTHRTAQMVSQRAKDLVFLSIDGVTDLEVEAICSNLNDIDVLIVGVNCMSSKGLMMIARTYKESQSISVSLQYGQIDDTEVSEIVQMSTNLVIWPFHPGDESGDDD